MTVEGHQAVSVIDDDSVAVSAEATGVDDAPVTGRARMLLRGVCLFVDRIDPGTHVDEMLATLLPGETTRFEVTGLPSPLRTRDLETRPVLRFVNDVSGPTRDSINPPSV